MRTQTEPILLETPGISECLDRLTSQKARLIPGATYRLQFNGHFGFRDAKALVPYLHSLGITTCYASPLLEARTGSLHGYDITNHNLLNPEIGTEEELHELTSELRAHG